jgi:hypothetical protein
MVLRPLFGAGETLAASKLQMLAQLDQTWQPELTAITINPTLGTGGIRTSHIWLSGNKVDIWFLIQFGTAGANAGTGTYYVPLPAAYPLMAGIPANTPAGRVHQHRASPDTTWVADMIIGSTTLAYMVDQAPGGGYTNHAYPWAWTINDKLLGHISYLTDFGL